jgi:hypothetical protein
MEQRSTKEGGKKREIKEVKKNKNFKRARPRRRGA